LAFPRVFPSEQGIFTAAARYNAAVSGLSGEIYEIEFQHLSASVTSVGATLRSFSCGAVPVIWSQPLDGLPVAGSGQVLAPWPNRLKDGSYVFDGITGQAALDEPARSNAIHGLVRWLEWNLDYLERSRVKLSCTLAPQPGYPFILSLAILYEIGPEGLTVRTQAESGRGTTAPFGIGFHPYFMAATKGLAGARVAVPATRQLTLDDRGLPVGDRLLDPHLAALATAEGVSLGDLSLDDCFTGLVRDPDGNATLRFFPGDGAISEVTLHLGRPFDYVMCFTGDPLAEPDRRVAVAIEPMTCPPNALATGIGVTSLHDGATFEAGFSIRPVLAG
jgi:aldose 1-epimerase